MTFLWLLTLLILTNTAIAQDVRRGVPVTNRTPPANVFYFSPTGDDSASGKSEGSAWKTATKLAAEASAGRTFIFTNGTYNSSNFGGSFDMLCSVGTGNGTAEQPITVKALNEREAVIQGDGLGNVFRLKNCSWWVLEGLRIRSTDNASNTSSSGNVLALDNSHNLVVKRMVLSRPNGYGNTGVIHMVNGSADVLFDTNEILNFHRNGYNTADNDVTRIRLTDNYFNCGNTKATAPYSIANPNSPNDALVFYGHSQSIAENNVLENCEVGIGTWGDTNKFYGNITAGNSTVGVVISHSTLESAGFQANNNEVYHHVSVADNQCSNSRTGLGTTKFHHSTCINPSGSGIGADNQYDSRRVPNTNCDGACAHQHAPNVEFKYSIVSDNSASGSGFYVNHNTEYGSIVADYLVNRGSSGYGSGLTGRTNSPPSGVGDVDPAVADCPIFPEVGDPYKGSGPGGIDLGANTLYRYESGVLSATKNWNSANNKRVRVGAIVAGVNDGVTTIHNIEARLLSACTYPVGY